TDTTKHTVTTLKIYDYFPQEIIDNFDFEHVTTPNIGNVSSQIDLENKCIIWTIDKLEPGEVANLSYKLTLKHSINTDILSKILDTNTKVDITANQLDEKISSDVTPKIRITMTKLSIPEPLPKPPEPTPEPDVAPTPIPQTGVNNI
ncbi:MAG: hypothetical protein IJ777_02165, partial [Clostridia bacterium]|nr:hypothetical protein [Clostridia bacterium]